MDALKGFIAKLFPFTPKGWVFLLLSAALLALGILRSELAVLLWGATFVLLGLYAAVGTLIARSLLAHRFLADYDALRVAVEPARVRRTAPATARIRASLPRYRVPGIRLYAGAMLQWRGRVRTTEALVEPDDTTAEVALDTSGRGVWQLAASWFAARDLLGFCSAPVPAPGSASLTVIPDASDTSVGESEGGAGGEHRIQSGIRRRSEELFETRRYVPGDDPRKINWKMFARWNELLVRIGEEVPPPQSRVVCYLYTGPAGSTSAGAPENRSPREQALEAAVSAFTGACRSLVQRGVQVGYGFGGVLDRGTVGARGERDYLIDVADADWDGGVLPTAEAHGAIAARPIVLVVPEGTEGIDEVRRKLLEHGPVAETIVARMHARTQHELAPWWHRVFFRASRPATARPATAPGPASALPTGGHR
ncbi:MAG: DUF58 domain-containing protein [Spirochaetes bacterium]|nr:DUF58 domain-containing protein [Spirochaetota bacterium]